MKKIKQIQQGDQQLIYGKSKNRLIEQNRQLYTEIFKLESKVNAVLTKNIANDFQQKVGDQKLSEQHKELTLNQVLDIKKLKKKILLIKNSDKPQQKQDVRQALDQLTYLKKQKHIYELQKQALLNKKNLKNQGLMLNKPLQSQQKELLSLYKSTQRQNFEIKSKSLKLQKQINNLHKIKELAKTTVPKQFQNNEFEIKKIQHEITKLRAEVKEIEKQWQPRIESLNTEYFVLKDVKEEKEQQLQDIVSNLNIYKNRVLVMKQESKILKDKVRISEIIVSPQKRAEISQIYQDEKQKRQFFEQFKYRTNIQPIKLSSSNIKLSTSKVDKIEKEQAKSKQKQLSKELSRIQTTKIFQTQISLTKSKQTQNETDKSNLEFNQFEVHKDFSHHSPKKVTLKQSASIGVGTTFYYNEQAQIQN